MSLQIYLLNGCPFAHRALIALREKGLDFEATYFTRGHRPPELEALGPFAKSPTLFDGEAKVFDSSVVLEYLEDRYPEPPLLPGTAFERAQVRMANARVADELSPKFGAVIAEAYFKPTRDEALVRAKAEDFAQALEPWERVFQGRTFAVGDRFTLADVTAYTFFPALRRAAGFEIPARYAALRAWHDRVASRPTTEAPKAP